MVCGPVSRGPTFLSNEEPHGASLLTNGTDLASESLRILGLLAF